MARGIRVAFNRVLTPLVASRGLFSVASAGATLTTSGRASTIKFHPQHAALSYNWDGTGAKNQSEMNALISTPKVRMYIAQYGWGHLETSQGVVNASGTFLQDFADLQARVNGCRFGFYIRGTEYSAVTQAQLGTATAAGLIPAYIRQCGGRLTSTDGTLVSTNFPLCPGGNEYGWYLSQYDGTSAYGVKIGAHLWHPVANSCLASCYKIILNTVVPDITINGVLYSGFTVGTHPYIECMGTNDEFSYDFTGENGFLKGSPPATDNSAQGPWAPTKVAGIAAVEFLMKAAVAASPNMTILSCLSYGISGIDGYVTGNDDLALLTNLYNNRVAFCNSDVQGAAYAPNWQGSVMQQLLVGNTYANMNVNVFTTSLLNPPGGGTSLVNPTGSNKMPVFAQIQEPDYHSGLKAGTLAFSAQAVRDIWTSCQYQGSNWAAWCMQDSNTGINAWSSYLYPTIATLSAPNLLLPTAYQ